MRWLIITILVLFPQQDLYKWGIPTSRGIDKYVEANWFVFIQDYQNHISDTLFYEPFISTDDLSRYFGYKGGDLGYFEYPDNIIVTNEPRYIDYELNRLSRFQKNQYRETNQFVRAVVMHELTHCYFYQNVMQVRNGDSLHIDFRPGLRIVPQDNYGADFLEDGFCEYVCADMDEMIPYDQKHFLIKNDLSTANRYSYEVKYRYAMQFITPVIQQHGLRHAIRTVVSHAAPNQEEILNPELYYHRLNQ